MNIQCQAHPFQVGSWTVVELPPDASQQLPSRGMCMVEGQLNGAPFQAPVEPDGRGGHWFHLTDSLRESTRVEADSTLTLSFEAIDVWPDPAVPEDLEAVLSEDAAVREAWEDTTTKARWDWTRWIRDTANPKTRAGRVEKARSMLNAGKRRPCCFDRARCTEPGVASNGKLKHEI